MEYISINNVSKSFSKKVIFENISLEIKQGSIIGIMGPNGCGKSVLMKMICGIYRPAHGEIYVRGKKIGLDFDFPPDIGALINAPQFLYTHTGFENLKLLAAIRGLISYKEIIAAMQMVGLDYQLKTKVKDYSQGMKQKLGIAQAFMEGQDILLLDEPFNALDEKSHENILRMLICFKKEGKTIILTSHNVQDLTKICTQIYKIENCKLFPVDFKVNSKQPSM